VDLTLFKEGAWLSDSIPQTN